MNLQFKERGIVVLTPPHCKFNVELHPGSESEIRLVENLEITDFEQC